MDAPHSVCGETNLKNTGWPLVISFSTYHSFTHRKCEVGLRCCSHLGRWTRPVDSSIFIGGVSRAAVAAWDAWSAFASHFRGHLSVGAACSAVARDQGMRRSCVRRCRSRPGKAKAYFVAHPDKPIPEGAHDVERSKTNACKSKATFFVKWLNGSAAHFARKHNWRLTSSCNIMRLVSNRVSSLSGAIRRKVQLGSRNRL